MVNILICTLFSTFYIGIVTCVPLGQINSRGEASLRKEEKGRKVGGRRNEKKRKRKSKLCVRPDGIFGGDKGRRK